MNTSIRCGGDPKSLRIHAKKKLQLDSKTHFQVHGELDTKVGAPTYFTALVRRFYPDFSTSVGAGLQYDKHNKLRYIVRGKKGFPVITGGLLSFNVKGKYDFDKDFREKRSKGAAEVSWCILNFQKDQDVRFKVGYNLIKKLNYSVYLPSFFSYPMLRSGKPIGPSMPILREDGMLDMTYETQASSYGKSTSTRTILTFISIRILHVDETKSPYTYLGASYVSVALLESLYYYVLRNAERCVVVRPNVLHEYLKGVLRFSGLQFPDVFPLNLHQQMWYPESFRIVKGIVVVDDPVTSYMKEDDLEKFKALCGLISLKIDIDECRKYRQQCQNFSKENDGAGFVSIGNGKPADRFQQKYKRRRCLSRRIVTSPEGTQQRGKDKPSWSTCKPVVLCAPRNIEASGSDPSIVLSGTVKRGAAGPPIGAVDIGISKVAYYFRVSLPGIRKDFCQFSCEIEPNGKVHLEGFTSGGNPIKKRSRVFHLKVQQVCPGPFTLSFNLPGPVDPRLFAPNFGSDGIFEGVILKEE